MEVTCKDTVDPVLVSPSQLSTVREQEVDYLMAKASLTP